VDHLNPFAKGLKPEAVENALHKIAVNAGDYKEAAKHVPTKTTKPPVKSGNKPKDNKSPK